jgi:hypothetical protein
MFEVEWTATAREELAQLWLQCVGEERRVVNETVSEIDRTLTRNATSAGESRSRLSQRILIQLPLGVWFEVERSGGGKLVAAVSHVWPIYKTHRGS